MDKECPLIHIVGDGNELEQMMESLTELQSNDKLLESEDFVARMESALSKKFLSCLKFFIKATDEPFNLQVIHEPKPIAPSLIPFVIQIPILLYPAPGIFSENRNNAISRTQQNSSDNSIYVIRITTESMGSDSFLEDLMSFYKNHAAVLLVAENYHRWGLKKKRILSELFVHMVFTPNSLFHVILPSLNEEHTLYFIRSLAKRLQIEHNPVQLSRSTARHSILFKAQQQLLEGLLQCGPKKVELITQQFRSPIEFFNALDSDLSKIRGIKGLGEEFIRLNRVLLKEPIIDALLIDSDEIQSTLETNTSPTAKRDTPLDNYLPDNSRVRHSKGSNSKLGQNEVILYVDSREPSSMVSALEFAAKPPNSDKSGKDASNSSNDIPPGGIEIKRAYLPFGDYILSSIMAVERKKGPDLPSSVFDMRFFRQLEELKQNFPFAVLLLENPSKIFTRKGVRESSIYGALAYVLIEFGIDIVPTASKDETANLLINLALEFQSSDPDLMPESPLLMDLRRKMQKGELGVKRRIYREDQLYLLQGLINVGAKMSERLLSIIGPPLYIFREFASAKIEYDKNGCPKKAFSDSLSSIGGLGPKTIEINKKLLIQPFKTSKRFKIDCKMRNNKK